MMRSRLGPWRRRNELELEEPRNSVAELSRLVRHLDLRRRRERRFRRRGRQQDGIRRRGLLWRLDHGVHQRHGVCRRCDIIRLIEVELHRRFRRRDRLLPRRRRRGGDFHLVNWLHKGKLRKSLLSVEIHARGVHRAEARRRLLRWLSRNGLRRRRYDALRRRGLLRIKLLGPLRRRGVRRRHARRRRGLLRRLVHDLRRHQRGLF
mmetsp:Transcript_9855/g.34653  ORF Transcript_9855/g.34653 Transcript_9855/m.34653 type:complete len:206 (+) Transcript_9855:1270-1887(+)